MKPSNESALFNGAKNEIVTGMSFTAAYTAFSVVVFHEPMVPSFEISLGGAAAILALGAIRGVLSSRNNETPKS